ncbi:Ion channel, partial [Ancylostoma caninum]
MKKNQFFWCTLLTLYTTSTKFFQAKYYYDKYNCRYFAPFLLLFFYSLLGAWIFYLVENSNEKEMKIDEERKLDRLRNSTFQRIVGAFHTRTRLERATKSRNLLLWYEKELQRVKLPEALEWDMWGALFYVGTIFTTIGYGNIVPRTVTGRALSVVYAIIGIPLVLAILSRFGQFLEHTITRAWLRHRDRIKDAHKKTRKRLTARSKEGKSLESLEEGKLTSPTPSEFLEEHLIEDSRTIPIWLALLFCISWICACAALFLIWEKRWTFFTSLYFFFISLSTIGLGDVVPDHPHMLILMFWLVIIGLSIVSMLLTVIQIKFEECLYNLMIRMQEEYHKNLASGTPFDHDEIRRRAMEHQPLLMKLFGPDLMSEDQREKIEEKAEQFERVVRITNNKNIQTEPPAAFGAGTQMEHNANSMACDPMSESDHVRMANGETQWSRQFPSMLPEEHSSDSDDHDSMSDATSLPMDSIRNGPLKDVTKAVDENIQTDIAQFQIDEIVLRLAALQANRPRSNLVDRGVEASLLCTGKRAKKRGRTDSIEDKSVKDMTVGPYDVYAIFSVENGGSPLQDKEILTTMLQVMTQSMESDSTTPKSTKDLGVNTIPHPMASCGVSTNPVSWRTQSIETDANDVMNKSIATDPATLMDKTTETSRSEQVDPTAKMSWDEKLRHDIMTSPLLRRLVMKTSGISRNPSSERDDHSQQTSLIIDPKRMDTDRSQQTSLIIDRPHPEVDRSVQIAPDYTDRMTSPIPGDSLHRSFQSASDEMADRSQQTSHEMVDRMQETSRVEMVTQGVGTDQVNLIQYEYLPRKKLQPFPEPGGYNPGTDWNHGSASMYEGRMTDSMTASTQYSPPMSRSVTTQNTDNLDVKNGKSRSLSTSGLGTSAYDDESRQEVIIQTDDSYLKIARRRHEYRSNRTQFLPVVAASPICSRDIEPFKTDRPSERRGFYIDVKGLQRKRSTAKLRRKMSHHKNRLGCNAEAQTGSSMDHELE